MSGTGPEQATSPGPKHCEGQAFDEPSPLVRNLAKVPLTVDQRRLVRENLGLVAVHLRRHVSNLAAPRRDREWEDLFQEGCLGLVDAAQRFRPERGIPFASFAFPRIHNAVSKALQSKFQMIYIPPQRAASRASAGAGGSSASGVQVPKMHDLSAELSVRLTAPCRPSSERSLQDTVGQRLRDKYERAVRAAGKWAASKASPRGDRRKLVQILIEERLLIPQDEAKRALRQVARDTHSSYARVAQCEKQLHGMIGQALNADPEFRALWTLARSSPTGADIAIDPEVERDLLVTGCNEFIQRYWRADPAERARMLHAVLRLSRANIEGIIRGWFSRLSNRVREELLESTADLQDSPPDPERAPA
ncbi:MAG: hypothetical protein KJ749_04235 [Planctomycetes bacterium]|nr:hypothetical protein [Planctomycetota bacterium]